MVRVNKLAKEIEILHRKYTKAITENDLTTAQYLENQKRIKTDELNGVVEQDLENLKTFSDKEMQASMEDANGGKGDRYSSQSQLEAMGQELESPYVDIEDNLDTIVQEELMTFDEATRQMEVDGKKVLEPMDQIIKETKEFSVLAKSFANCITRGR